MTISIDDAKSMARRLRTAMEAGGLPTTHSDSLELVAAQLGFRDWNAASATLNAPAGPRFTQAIPVLLSLDEAACRAFYCEFLGFELASEHRSAPGRPAHLDLRRGSVELHLSPHRRDATAGSVALLWMTDVEGYRRELAARKSGAPVPSAIDRPWGRELELVDPFGNRLRFCERRGRTIAGEIGAQVSSGGEAATYEDALEFGAELPGVKASASKMGVALKVGREILACTAIHPSAEPDSLMVRVGGERRDALLEENPGAFYLTEHYRPYPVVLVRLSKIKPADLDLILKEGWAFIRSEGT